MRYVQDLYGLEQPALDEDTDATAAYRQRRAIASEEAWVEAALERQEPSDLAVVKRWLPNYSQLIRQLSDEEDK
jgi:hypothetical protein